MGDAAPVVVWGLDPSYFTYRKVFVDTIMSLIVCRQRNGYFEYILHDRPVSRVEIVGVVVEIKRSANRIVFTVDDGTGLIRCLKFLASKMSMDTSDPMRHADVGSVVVVQGVMEQRDSNEFEYQITLKVNSVNPTIDPNMEAYHWTSCMYLDECEYSQPAHAPSLQVAEYAPSTDQADVKGTFDSLRDGSLCVCSGAHNKRVQSDLLYCPCVSAACDVDPKGKFRLALLDQLLQHNRLVFSESMMLKDATLRYLGKQYLVETKDAEMDDVYGTAALGGLKAGNDNEHALQNIDESKVDMLISRCFQSVVQDGIFAPLNARAAGTHQLVTRDLIQKLLKATVVSHIKERAMALDGEAPDTFTEAEITGELREDPHLKLDSIASLTLKAPFLHRWRMQTVIDEL